MVGLTRINPDNVTLPGNFFLPKRVGGVDFKFFL
jgi:hypothetical protein